MLIMSSFDTHFYMSFSSVDTNWLFEDLVIYIDYCTHRTPKEFAKSYFIIRAWDFELL